MKTTIAIALAAVLAGCVSGGTQVKQSTVDTFQKGVTTEADVRRQLGEPQGMDISTDGTRTITYTGMKAGPNAASFIPVVGLFAGKSHVQTSVVRFSFASDGKLNTITTSHTSAEAGMFGSSAATEK